MQILPYARENTAISCMASPMTGDEQEEGKRGTNVTPQPFWPSCTIPNFSALVQSSSGAPSMEFFLTGKLYFEIILISHRSCKNST